MQNTLRAHWFNLVSSGSDFPSRSHVAVISKLLMFVTVWTAPTVTHVLKIFFFGPVVVNLLLSC